MFRLKSNFTINQLVSSDLFLGYYSSTWNSKINYFLLGSYRFSNLFNLNYTYSLLKKGFYLMLDLFFKKSSVWLVNENFSIFYKNELMVWLNKNFREIYFYNFKWYKGLLSNFKYVKAIRPFQFPHLIISPNVPNNFYAINEAFIINIPSMALVDTTDNPSNLFFPLPGNSKSIKSLFMLYLLVAKSCFYARYFASSSFLFSFTRKLKPFNHFFKNKNYLSFYFSFLVKDKSLNFSKILFYFILNLKIISKLKTFNNLSLNYYLNSLFLAIFKVNKSNLKHQKKYLRIVISLIGVLL